MPSERSNRAIAVAADALRLMVRGETGALNFWHRSWLNQAAEGLRDALLTVSCIEDHQQSLKQDAERDAMAAAAGEEDE